MTYLCQLKGYLELAERAEQHTMRLARADVVERAEYAARFSTAAAAHDGGDAAAQALAARLRVLAAALGG